MGVGSCGDVGGVTSGEMIMVLSASGGRILWLCSVYDSVHISTSAEPQTLNQVLSDLRDFNSDDSLETQT